MSTPSRVLPLDGVRGAAILAVFLYHYAGRSLFAAGWIGVDLFFVLSGFLITGILLETKDDPAYFRTFYARRSLRIFPIYYLFLAVCLVLVPVALWQPAHLWFLVYLGYPAALIWPLDAIPIRITHLWSLSIEEQFYLLWPAIVRHVSPSRLLRVCGAAFVGSLLLRVALLPFEGWSDLFLFCRVDGLAVGAALAIWRRQSVSVQPSSWCVAGLIGFVALALWRGTVARGDVWISTLGYSLLAIGFGGLVMLSLGPLARIFSLRVLRIFGTYSYGLYLYHLPLLPLLATWQPPIVRATNRLGFVLVALAVNLAVAMLSFHFIEQPILRLKSRFAYRAKESPKWRLPSTRSTQPLTP